MPCLSLGTFDHSLAPSTYPQEQCMVVGTKCLNQHCMLLDFSTCLLFLLCFVVLDNRVEYHFEVIELLQKFVPTSTGLRISVKRLDRL